MPVDIDRWPALCDKQTAFSSLRLAAEAVCLLTDEKGAVFTKGFWGYCEAEAEVTHATQRIYDLRLNRAENNVVTASEAALDAEMAQGRSNDQSCIRLHYIPNTSPIHVTFT